MSVRAVAACYALWLFLDAWFANQHGWTMRLAREFVPFGRGIKSRGICSLVTDPLRLFTEPS